MNLSIGRKAIAAIFYGDLIMALRNQDLPLRGHQGPGQGPGGKMGQRSAAGSTRTRASSSGEMKAAFPKIAKDFAAIPVVRTPKVKVGIVGEIYVKYSPLGNNNLEKILASQDCEVNLPRPAGFAGLLHQQHGRHRALLRRQPGRVWGSEALLKYSGRLRAGHGQGHA